MFNFTINFSAIIGDLIPKDDECWNLYITLRQIMSIVMGDVVSDSMCDVSSDLIKVHHETYKSFFGNLKPKFHLMIHYPNIQRLIGPLKDIWSMRFESNHQFYKRIAYCITSKKNLLHSFCLKNQLHMANIFANYEEKEVMYELGPLHKIEINILEKYGVVYNTGVCEEPLLAQKTSWVKVNAVILKPETVIEYGRYEDGSPQFALINFVIIKNEKVKLCLQEVLDLGFDHHLQSYIVDLNEIFFSIKLDINHFYKIYYIQKIKQNLKIIRYGI